MQTCTHLHNVNMPLTRKFDSVCLLRHYNDTHSESADSYWFAAFTLCVSGVFLCSALIPSNISCDIHHIHQFWVMASVLSCMVVITHCSYHILKYHQVSCVWSVTWFVFCFICLTCPKWGLELSFVRGMLARITSRMNAKVFATIWGLGLHHYSSIIFTLLENLTATCRTRR